jgi:ubiquinone biosynthesis accessory factor UbiJ
MLVTTPLLSLEQLLNRAIAASTPARAALSRLEGRSFAVAFVAGGDRRLRLRLCAAPEGLRLSVGEDAADATVSGTPLRLLQLIAGRARGGSHQPGVTVAGDATVVQGFETLFQHAQPDVEAELARLIGDRPAHHAWQVARGALATGRRFWDSLTRSTGEYLVEESRDVVGRDELASFADEVDRLRDDVARLEARLARLAVASGART